MECQPDSFLFESYSEIVLAKGSSATYLQSLNGLVNPAFSTKICCAESFEHHSKNLIASFEFPSFRTAQYAGAFVKIVSIPSSNANGAIPILKLPAVSYLFLYVLLIDEPIHEPCVTNAYLP